MSRTNFQEPPSFGVDPGLSETATRKDEFVHAVAILDCEEQVKVRRNVLDRADMAPHIPFLPLAGYATLI
jgi:hypothetical protein